MAKETVWAVVYSNYDPPELDSLWTTKERALVRKNKLNEDLEIGAWEIIPWVVEE